MKNFFTKIKYKIEMRMKMNFGSHTSRRSKSIFKKKVGDVTHALNVRIIIRETLLLMWIKYYLRQKTIVGFWYDDQKEIKFELIFALVWFGPA